MATYRLQMGNTSNVKWISAIGEYRIDWGPGYRIYLANNDRDTPHNLSIYATDPAKDKQAEQLYKGKPVKGPGQEEYAVDALPAGEYYFQDDKTPGMKGVVQIPKKK